MLGGVGHDRLLDAGRASLARRTPKGELKDGSLPTAN
jgi:hypothetical protein